MNSSCLLSSVEISQSPRILKTSENDVQIIPSQPAYQSFKFNLESDRDSENHFPYRFFS